MPSAQHGGMWLLGTVREGSTRNTGATTVTQQATITFPQAGEVVFAQLPAGASIENIRILAVSTATANPGNTPFSLTPVGGAATQIGQLNYSGTTAGAATVSTYSLGAALFPTPAGAPLWQNIGPVDARISCNIVLPAGVTWYISVNYTVRNPDGTATRVR